MHFGCGSPSTPLRSSIPWMSSIAQLLQRIMTSTGHAKHRPWVRTALHVKLAFSKLDQLLRQIGWRWSARNLDLLSFRQSLLSTITAHNTQAKWSKRALLSKELKFLKRPIRWASWWSMEHVQQLALPAAIPEEWPFWKVFQIRYDSGSDFGKWSDQRHR